MILKSLAIFVTTIGLITSSYAQTPNSVNVTPHWKKDETHIVKITSTTIDHKNGKIQNYLSTFDARFMVKDVSDSGYKVEWTYISSKLADNEPVLENQIIAKLTTTKLIIKLSNVGKFVELINVEEVKATCNKVVDELIANSATNPTMNVQLKAAKQLISTKQGLEIALLKQIKFYTYSFGFQYESNIVQSNNIKIPNPFGGQPFDGVEKVQMTKLDNKNLVCTIETSKVLDGNTLKMAVIDYVKKVTNSNPQAMDEMKKTSLEMTENTMQQIDLSKGLIQKSLYKRIMNIGFQNRTTSLEEETVD